MYEEKKNAINTYLMNIKKGDGKSVERLYDEIAPTIRHIALKYLRDPDDADDLVQDFWADIFKISKGFVFASNGFAYLCKVMTRKALNRYKALKRENSRTAHVDYAQLHIANGNMDMAEINMVEAALDKLSEQERIIIELTYFEDKTVRQIASELGMSKSEVDKLKIKATDKMKQYFDVFVDKSGL